MWLNTKTGDPLSGESHQMTRRMMQDHKGAVTRDLWTYADRHHRDDLDGGSRIRRPPVFDPRFASNNIVVPPDGTKSDDIRAAIPIQKRHRWFRSMNSSQALTQSVFAVIHAYGRLDLLENVSAECGRPAFFRDRLDWTMSLEYEVNGLNEPSPTNIDVLLSNSDQRVAVECKFSETEFGECSRPKERDPKKHCDGSYHVQNGRRHRCALSEHGIRYWEHLPHLFNWPSDRDHEPCPFRGTYQLARNAIAATMTVEDALDPIRGHALVIYDSRNPAFRPGGKADGQWQDAAGNSLHQGLLRRLSWQTLLQFLAEVPELAYLVDGLCEKYGLKPDEGDLDQSSQLESPP